MFIIEIFTKKIKLTCILGDEVIKRFSHIIVIIQQQARDATCEITCTKIQNLVEYSIDLQHSDNFSVFGFSFFSAVIGFTVVMHLVNGPAVDYMHAILHGVQGLLLDLWFDSKNHNERYYIGRPNQLRKINENIKMIRPPKAFNRQP